jgi:hypothetical protein
VSPDFFIKFLAEFNPAVSASGENILPVFKGEFDKYLATGRRKLAG